MGTWTTVALAYRFRRFDKWCLRGTTPGTASVVLCTLFRSHMASYATLARSLNCFCEALFPGSKSQVFTCDSSTFLDLFLHAVVPWFDVKGSLLAG